MPYKEGQEICLQDIGTGQQNVSCLVPACAMCDILVYVVLIFFAIELQAELIVYDDRLRENWKDWSWKSQADFGHRPGFESPSCISVHFKHKYAGLSLRFHRPIKSHEFSHLRFWAKSQEIRPLSFAVYVHIDDKTNKRYDYHFTTSKSDWGLVSVSNNLLGSPIKRINIQNTKTNGPNVSALFDAITFGNFSDEQQKVREHLIYYDNTLEPGWTDWSWGTEVNFGADSGKNGRAIEVNFKRRHAAFSLRNTFGLDLNLTNWKALVFDCKCMECDAEIQVLFREADYGEKHPSSILTCSSRWKQLHVSLNIFKPKQLKRLGFQDRSGVGGATVLLDNIFFVV